MISDVADEAASAIALAAKNLNSAIKVAHSKGLRVDLRCVETREMQDRWPRTFVAVEIYEFVDAS